MPFTATDLAMLSTLSPPARVVWHRMAAAWLVQTGEDLDAQMLVSTGQHCETYRWGVHALHSGLIAYSERENTRAQVDLLRRSIRERMRLAGLLPHDAPPLGALRLDRLDADIAALCGIAAPMVPSTLEQSAADPQHASAVVPSSPQPCLQG